MTTGRPTAATVLRLAVTGNRTDRARIALTAVGAAAAALALLAAATVAVIDPGDGPYTSELLNQPGLHVGVVITLVLLCVPLLAFTGQCTRVGAPARDRRLATLRLVGATPGEVRRVAAVETGVAALLGSALGAAAYALVRVLVDTPVTATYGQRRTEESAGGTVDIVQQVTGPALRLPTDVLPPAWVFPVVVLALPLLAAAFAVLALRRVSTTPFGVVRRRVVRPVQALPATLFLLGGTGLAVFTGLGEAVGLDEAAPEVGLAVAGVLFLMTTAGLVLGTAAISARLGAAVAARTGRPAVLLAARRLVAEPFAASRANAALLVVVLLAAGAQGYRAWLLTEQAGADTDFYADTMDVIDLALVVAGAIATTALLVGLVERVVSGRRVTASLTAAGVPRSVLLRTVLAEVVLPVLPAGVLALVAGALAPRGMFGTTVQIAEQQPDGSVTAVSLAVPVPWAALAVVLAAVVAATLLVAAAAVPLLPRRTDPAELRAT